MIKDYHLSDLAQLTIRKFEDANSWNIQALPGKIRLPLSLYKELGDHAKSQQIAEHHYLPEGVEEGVGALVRSSMRATSTNTKKRRSDADHRRNGRDGKKQKTLPVRKAPGKEKKSKPSDAQSKTPKRPKKRRSDESEAQASERRRSGRVRIDEGTYRERGDDEDDREMGQGVASWKYVNDDEDEEMGEEKEVTPDTDNGNQENDMAVNGDAVDEKDVPKADNAENIWEVTKSPAGKSSSRIGASPRAKTQAASATPTKGGKKTKAKGR